MATSNMETHRANMSYYKIDIKKILTVFFILNFINIISSQKREQVETLSADGWRPIISRPQQVYYQDSVAEAVRQHTITTAVPYLNQQHQNQANLVTTKPTPKTSQAPNVVNSQRKNTNQNNNQDVSKQTKFQSSAKVRTNPNVIPAVNLGKIFGNNQDIILHGNYPSQTRNQHVNAPNHNVKAYSTISPFGHNFAQPNMQNRHPVMGKLQAHMTLVTKRRKPGQHHSATTRDEVYLSPSSGILGTIPFFHTAPLKGLAIHHGSPSKHYILPGTIPPQIEFPSHYSPISLVNDDLIKQFMRDNNQIGNQYFFPKYTLQNNLAAPPFKAIFTPDTSQYSEQKQKLENLKISTTAATINDPQLIIGKQKFAESIKKPEEHKVIVPENIVVQLPPPHNSAHYLQKPKTEVELEITRENFNIFKNDIPPNYKPFQHYQLQTFLPSDAKTPQSQVHHQAHTYEVTEDGTHDSVTLLPTPYKLPKNRTNASVIYSSYFETGAKSQNLNRSTSLHYLTQNDLNKNQYNHLSELPTQLSVPSKDSERINYAQNEITTAFQHETPSASTASSTNHYNIIDPTVSTTTERSRRPKTTTTTTTTTTVAPSKNIQNTRNYLRNRNTNRRRKPLPKPTLKYRESATTVTTLNENQNAEESKIIETDYQTTTNKISKYSKPYRTTPTSILQESEITQQTTPTPTLATQHKYKSSPGENDEETGKLLKKHRVRPADFVDEFEDSEYLRNKYQEFDNVKTHRYKNHKQTYTQIETQTESNDEHFAKKNQFKNIKNKPTQENQDYTSFEPTKQSELEYLSSKVYPTEFFSSNTDYSIPQKYTKSTTVESSPLNLEESVENFEIAKITENEVDPKNQKEIPTTNESVKDITTTRIPNIFQRFEIKEIITTAEPETTTLSRTTTTIDTTTPKVHRIRPKPSRYDGNRPRFSVKDYRHRLQTSTTEPTKVTSESTSVRIRFPPKIRNSQTSTTSPEEVTNSNEDNIAEHSSNKYSTEVRKFATKETRYKTERSTTEKSYRPNRVRPTNGKHHIRTRTTTENSNVAAVIPPPKVVIKSSSSLLRRPQTISLRNKIAAKQKNQDRSTSTSTTEQNNDFESTKNNYDDTQATFSSLASAETSYTKKWNLRPEVSSHRFNIEELFEQSSERNKPPTTNTENNNQRNEDDINSHLSYSQRISDLTSLSASQNNDKNGIFKTVATNTSRRVPNYFTIATDDPILPIEAFFPQLTQKESSKK